MNRHRGFVRIRVVGLVTLLVGVVLLAILLLSQGAGYGPNPGFVHLYVALWPISLEMMVLGAVVLGLSWAVRGLMGDGTGDGVRGLER